MLVVKYLLPGMSDVVTKTLYASNISTDEEVLVDAARRMLGAGDAAAPWSFWNATGRKIPEWCVPG